ncbi:MAG: trehalose 6-phosphate synthase [Spirochaetota bacterium]
MQTLSEFYEFMDEVHTVRHAIVGYYLMQAHNPQHVRSLEQALDALDQLPGEGVEKRLRAGDEEVTLSVGYERGELEKDIFFLGHDDAAFGDWLASRHDPEESFREQTDALFEFLRGVEVRSFITDRDGTVNNYCGRYRSSHQSVWNAVYLTRFVRSIAGEPLVLTSAPLMNPGLLELSAMPAGSTNYAGSKGREYHSRKGNKGAMELTRAQSEALESLNERLRAMLGRGEYRAFALVGSGLQYKFGQTTVARQDIHDSIPAERSERFLDDVRGLVDELDPHGSTFSVEDTGKDIEITLTLEGGREFTKGEGVSFLNDKLGLGLGEVPVLVCGDTASDVPMVETAVARGGQERTAAVFVTADESLRERVRSHCARSHFVDAPDVLVAALYRLARERI